MTVRIGGGERTIAASEILVAAGRAPNTSGIGLDVAGVQLDQRGYVAVNDRLETSAPDVWAIGECAGSPQFTHISVDDYHVIKANLDGGSRTTRGRQVPFCVFTDPPLSFLVSTPAARGKSTKGVPILTDVGQFLVKDAVLLGASVLTLGEAMSRPRLLRPG